MALTFGSLFAGIGGFDLGFERASMQCLWQVEIDGKCNAVRRKHWPDASHHEDVKEFHAENAIRPDIICGGFPCQDLSVAGRRAGLAGERSGLFHEFMRVVAEFRPSWVCIENVPGLYSSWSGDSPSSLDIEPGPGREMVLEERSDLDIVTKRLGEFGYRWALRCLDAQYFGVAQRRRRVFIVANTGDGPHPAEILFDSESLSRNPPTRGEEGQGVADCLTAGAHPGSHNGQDDNKSGRLIVGPLQTGSTPNGHGMAGVNNQAVNSGHVVPVQAYRIHGEYSTAMNGNGVARVADECEIARSLDSNGGYATNQGGNIVAFQERGRDGGREVNWQDDIAYSLNNPGKGGRRQENCIAFSQNQREELRDLEDKAGALASEPGMHQQTFLAGAGVRRLTPRECERLQGFPDDWTRWDADGNEISDSARYRMLGNAVAVPVSEWIGRRIIEAAKHQT